MPASSIMSSPSDTLSDERREWIRIDDQVLLEYRLLTDPVDRPPPALGPVTQEVIAAAVNKPTADLLVRAGELLGGSPLLPWIRKVDWLLEIILKALAAQQPDAMSIARVTRVNISGGGISFSAPCAFAAGDSLALTLVLPPFTPIHTVAKVIRTTPEAEGRGFVVATQFQDLASDDQESIIRHIIHTQAERLRARRNGS